MSSHHDSELITACLRVPQHVVRRTFAVETIVLNLRTGRYHGLNSTAGRMLDALLTASSVGAVIPGLARDYGVDETQVEADLLALCRGLFARDLLEIADAEPK